MKNKLGVDTIIILVAIIIVAILLIIALTNKGKEIEGNFTSTKSSSSSSMPGALKQANDADLFKFRELLKGYKGTQSGQSLRALFSKVEEMKQDYPDRPITITGVTSAAELDKSKTYNVTMSEDSDGYYNIINIEEKK